MILVWRLWNPNCPDLARSVFRCGWIAVAVGIFCTAWTALGKWFDRDDIQRDCLKQVPSQVRDRTAVCRDAQKKADTLYILLWVHFIAYFLAGGLALSMLQAMKFFTPAGVCSSKSVPGVKGRVVAATLLYGLTAGTSLGVIALMDQMGQARKQWGTVAVEAAVAYMSIGDMLALPILYRLVKSGVA